MSELTYIEPNFFQRMAYRVQRFPSYAKDWLARRLLRAVVRLAGDSNYISHAKRELAPSLADGEDGPNRWMADGLIELLAVFAFHGHSGSSAPYCASAFKKLANFEPLGPLTGADDEWHEVGDGVFQNMRCSHVFKQRDRYDGQAYDIYGRVFREASGACFTSGESHVPVTFPYTPKSEYVDLPS